MEIRQKILTHPTIPANFTTPMYLLRTYPLESLHSRDTQTYRPVLEHIQQADQHLHAVKVEHAHEDAALQFLSHVCPLIRFRFRDLESDEG